jgi:UDP-glucose 4-epimerase
MELKNKRILVTGGAGYIGSHTAVELLGSGADVVIVDNLSNAREEVIGAIGAIAGRSPEFHRFDLCDAGRTDALIASTAPDAVIHFAAFKAVGESVEQPLRYYRNNLVSLLNLLESCLRHGVHHVIFSSSCSVYGHCEQLPVAEDAPLQKAESPYGNTKQISEEILEDTVRVHPDLHVIALRYFNPAGAHASAHIGEYPLQPPNNLVPVITQTAIGIRPSMTVFGDGYATPDGTCIRDFVHVVDIARAHVVAAERLVAGKNTSPYEVFNLGTGKGHTVFEAIRAFEKVSGQKVNFSVGARREGDVEKVWADTTLANRVLGWKAERSLEDILQSAWKWEQELYARQHGHGIAP